jgi:2,3-dihydroxybiphenyl 1,2-dioxygenase
MTKVRQLQYIVLGAKDLDAWEAFATAGIGMVTRERTDDTLYLRSDRAFTRVIIVKSENEDVQALGWGISGPEDFEAFKAKLAKLGRSFELIEGEEALTRKALKLLRLKDDDGIVHEIAYGIAGDDKTPFISPIVKDGFCSGDLGLGHVVLSIADQDRAEDFMRDVLGMKTSAHLLFPGGFRAVFLRCNARHHTVALSESHRAKKLQHLQIEYNSMDDLGRALDRAEDLPMEIVATLGKHVSDWVTSFYVRAPSDVTVELAYGARLMDEDEPTEYEMFSGSIWVHRKGMENA